MSGSPIPSPLQPSPDPRDLRVFWRRHRSYVIAIGLLLAALLAMDSWLVLKRHRYQREISRLRSGMSEFERKRTDAVLATNERKMALMMELLRRQARIDPQIHLGISVDSGRMYLEREGALLRVSPAEVGPEKRVGVPPDTVHLAIPRGTRSVQRILEGGGWEVPKWVFRDRGLPVPSERSIKGALGPVAVLLSGGAVIYSLPKSGPLNDSAYVMPGSVRVSAADLSAVLPNLKAGTPVYFY
ncbi:MAG: hypothetical protein M3068_09905 [Gemmatimonadota bacterium]|nr:hypothetical protein [Gemmatimonadota bacterium]